MRQLELNIEPEYTKEEEEAWQVMQAQDEVKQRARALDLLLEVYVFLPETALELARIMNIGKELEEAL